MSDLDTSFAKLLGRQPSDAARQALYRIRDALGLKDNDALWLIIMALQFHQELYEKIPDAIKAVTAEVLGEVNETAKMAMHACAEAAKADLAAAVAATAHQVARDTATKEKAQWISAAVISVAACLFGVFVLTQHWSYNTGYAKGQSVGYRESKDEKAAAAWANTPEGKLAYRLAESGELQRLARCQGNGWRKEKGACIPYPVDDKIVHGWRLP